MPERNRHFRHAHGHTGVAGVGLLNRVHGKGPNGIGHLRALFGTGLRGFNGSCYLSLSRCQNSSPKMTEPLYLEATTGLHRPAKGCYCTESLLETPKCTLETPFQS